MTSQIVRAASGVAAIALAIWTLVLFMGSPTIEFQHAFDGEPASVTVDCQSVMGYLDTSYSSDELVDQGGLANYTVAKGELPSKGVQYDKLEGICDRARTARTGLMALFAAPTAVLAYVALRRPRDAVTTPQDEVLRRRFRTES